jgi:hypothetical protein
MTISGLKLLLVLIVANLLLSLFNSNSGIANW